MSKRKHNITLRVYDSAGIRKEYANCQDRYALYFPYPKEWIASGHVADILPFNFSHSDEIISRFCWDEWNRKNGYASMLGKKVKIDILPKHVQKWVNGYEKVWNDLINNPDDIKARTAWLSYH